MAHHKTTWLPQKAVKLSKSPAVVYQLKITLIGSEPPIWRRALVSGNVSLGWLDHIIQTAMGWTNSHMHVFMVGKRHFGQPHPELEHFEDEDAVRLCDIAPRARASFVYEYDTGDSWDHEVRVEKIDTSAVGFHGFPVCLEGARSCPPEDCGGIGGYADFLAAIRDSKHPNHKDMLDWIGGSFDPEKFDLTRVNKTLRKIKHP